MRSVTVRCSQCAAPLAFGADERVRCSYCGTENHLRPAEAAPEDEPPWAPVHSAGLPNLGENPVECPDCSRKNPRHYRFCLGCGTDLRDHR